MVVVKNPTLSSSTSSHGSAQPQTRSGAMALEIKAVPSFYCCYLLRSKVNHTKLYVGSTPNPKRRLDQHNGVVVGGAKKTGFRGGVWRPWEMSLIVTGFPSSIAALQFEWAWQNTHLTRKISTEQRITIPHTVTKWSKKKGKMVTKIIRPPVILKDKLENLHLLLRVPSFARWPLQLRFFRKDIYESWIKWTSEMRIPLREGLVIVHDFEDGSEASDISSAVQARINALDVSYLPFKDRIEKSLILKKASNLKCACCSEKVNMEDQHVLVCTKKTCYSASHLPCLSSRFLTDTDELVPLEGECPKCQTRLNWMELVQELTLRTRDKDMVAKLLKPKRRKGGAADASISSHLLGEEEDDDPDARPAMEDILDEPSMHDIERLEVSSVASIDSDAGHCVEEGELPQDSGSRYDLTTVIPDSEDSNDWKMID